jgi:hypothetical protein
VNGAFEQRGIAEEARNELVDQTSMSLLGVGKTLSIQQSGLR